MSEIPAQRRAIRSFVKRDSRITSAQKEAIEQHWETYGVDFTAKPINLRDIYNRTAPKILDIGTGMGDSTLSLAQLHPENDYLAVEVHLPGVGSLIHKAEKLQLSNIRIINRDILDILEHQLENNSLDEICIFFPDPWHKKRHHKRRLINIEFFQLLLTVLKPHGRIFIATDWQDYAEHILEASRKVNGLINLSGNNQFAPRPYWRPLTKFEKRGINLEHEVWDLVFCKKNNA